VSSLPEQIVLVGLPGSGKTTIGPLLAARLEWSFVDFDSVIEAEAGLTIREIFAQKGEAAFREFEAGLTARLASVPRLVAAPGGGWIVRNQLPHALLVWLQVSPQEASRRIAESASTRPLLQGDVLERMKELLAERATYYERAALHIDTNHKTAEDVADEIAVAFERYGNQEK
jgi:shikimate kinase